MNSKQAAKLVRASSRASALLAAVFCALAFATSAAAQPVFSKAFDPSTIGPNSTSLLVFSIDNGSGIPVTDLAFTDTLPADVVIATPGLPATDCDTGTVTAPDGGTTIGFANGGVGAFSNCIVTVQVTSAVAGVYMNVSGDLTSDAGNSGPASADLTVSDARPGFSKSFSPSSGPLGTRATLTFDIDNSANAGFASAIGFTDVLPPGMVIADPANAATDCTGATLTAASGSDTISIFNGLLLSGQTCTVTADVVADAVGTLHNASGILTSSPGGAVVESGFATDTFTSTGGRLILVKAFLDDPVLPGGTVDLEFRILNRDPANSASNVSFTDDLAATLTGLTFDSLQSNSCGGTVSGTGSSLLTFSGGSLPARSECALVARLSVPAGDVAGAYPNVTSAVTADLDVPIVANAASDTLFVTDAPSLTKTFLTNPTAGGNTVSLEFTILNTSATSSATDIAFTDNLSTFLSGVTYVSGFQSGICGAGSGLTTVSSGGDTLLNFFGGNLAPSASCTFTADLEIPAGASLGDYLNTTSAITATVDGTTQQGNPASDTLAVVAAPGITKSFTDDPVLPGGTVTLEFTLSHDAASSGDATAITFTDDLNAALAGLAAAGLPMNDVCGTGSTLSGTSLLTLAGGTLAPGESCTFSVALQVPAGAPPGVFTNTTSNVSATVSGVVATGRTAQDDLTVSGLNIQKQFLDEPIVPGRQTTLRFTIDNSLSGIDATNMVFTDNLTATLSGLEAVALPATPCGAGSSITGTNFLIFTGGNLSAGASCTFDVQVLVPAGAANGTYSNVTSSLSADIDGSTVTLPPATDQLVVDSNILLVSKLITGGPVQPGDSLTMEIGLTNFSSTETITSIALDDDLGAALGGLTAGAIVSNDCGFSVSGLGTGLLSFTGGSLSAAAACTVAVTLQIPGNAPAGVYTNTTSEAQGTVGGIMVTGVAASADFRIVATRFSKSFAGPSVAGGAPVLNFTLTNLDASNGIGSLAFIDDLDAVLGGLVATGLPQADVCGSGSSISGVAALTFIGGQLAPAGSPGDSCTFQVTLAVPGSAAPGSYPNVTSELTSAGLVVSDPASAALIIEPPPTFGKVFQPNAIAVDGASTLTFTIDNSASALPAGNLSFVDALPAGLEVASPANASNTCGATMTAASGSGSVSLSGGSVAAGATCTAQVDITGTAEGTFVNTSGDLMSTSGNSGSATDTIDVVSGEFVVAKSFRTEPVLPAGVVEMEISIVNGSAFPLTGITLNDDLDAALAGLVAEGLPQADVCGAGSQLAGTSIVTLTGGILAAGGSCTIVIPVRVPAGATAGSFVNTTSAASGVREGVPVTADPDSANLVVEPLGFTKSFDAGAVAAGDTVNIMFEISNPDPANAASGVTFSDDLEAFIPGMTAANTPLADACGPGSLVNGTSTITLTDGTLPAGGSCSFQVTLNVPADAVSGQFTNTTSALTSSVGGTQTSAAAASAVLGIEPAPAFTKAFSPDTVGIGEPAMLTFTIDNSASQLDADSLAFEDILPAGMTVAPTPALSNGCGGTLVAGPDTDLIQLTAGSVVQGAVCRIEVDVIASLAGTLSNVSGELTSSLGNSGSASAELTVIRTLPVPLLSTAWLLLFGLLMVALGMHALTNRS